MKRLINGRMLPNKGMRRMWELKPVKVGSVLKTIYWDGTLNTAGANISLVEKGAVIASDYIVEGKTSFVLIHWESGEPVIDFSTTEKGIYTLPYSCTIQSFENPDSGLQDHIWGAH